MSLAELIVVTSEISRPLAETGGGFVSIRMPVDISAYRDSDESLPMRMATKVLAHLCPPPSSFRIPIIAITGTNGKTTTSRIVSRILEVAGYRVGLACTDGVYINQELRQSGVMSGVAGTLLTLQYKEIDLAVLEISRGGLVSRGLAFDQCEAAACTNVADDHIGFEGIDTLDQMAVLKRLVVESARRWIVLNARDPRCLSMANRHDDRTICLVARDFREAEILTYLRDGYVLVGLRSDGPNKILCCWQNDRVIDFGDITTFPITFDGIAEHNVDNILHAVGLALAMGVDDELITRALRGIIPGLSETPARLNIYNRLPFTVIIDFAHNAHGLIALGGFIEKLDRHRDRNRIAVFPSRTRWSESQIVEASRVIASTFDYVVCRDPKHLRNCNPGEPSQNLANALLSVGMVEDHVSVIPDRVAAIKCALSLARSGDIVVCFSCYDHEEIWDQLDEYQQSMAANTA